MTAEAGAMRAMLLCRPRPGKSRRFELTAEQSVMGCEAGMAISIPLSGISRRHARVTFDGKFYWIEDLKSTNGTFLNGRLVERERLRHLDVISLGKKLDLIFMLRSEDLTPVKQEGVVRAALVPSDAEADEIDVAVGELTLGRSTACNVVIESNAVSKVHARIERGPTEVLVQDLGSSNGTFVNNVRVLTSPLHDGDVLSLAGVVTFRVKLERGEVTSGSGGGRSRIEWAVPASQSMLRPQFGSEWRTRFEWDSAELRDLEQLRKLGPREPPTAPARPGAAASGDGPQGTVVRTRGAKAAPVAAAGATKAVPKVGPGAAAARPPAPPARPEAPKAEAKPPAAPSTPPPPAVPVPEAKPPAPAPPAPKITQPVAPAGPPAPTPTGVRPVAGPGTAIQRIRLSGSGFELFVSETGAHQLGRAKDEGTLRVDHPTVSRRHARVILADDRGIAYVQDLGGANGTLLNGRPLEKLAPLTEGDRIQIGEVELTVTFERG